jgi:hypothetical protein
MPVSNRKKPSDQSAISSGGMKNIVEPQVHNLYFASRAVTDETRAGFL